MVVFDLANLISLGHCQQWLNEAAQSNTEPYYIFLIGTKRDLLVNHAEFIYLFIIYMINLFIIYKNRK